MCTRATITLAMFSIAGLAAASALPEGPFEATVEAVTGGDAVRVVTADGGTLAALYGVSCHARAPEGREAAEDFVRDRTEGQIVTVRVAAEVAGLPYVQVELPTGEMLNHLMLAHGVADLDSLTGADDAELEAHAEAGRDAMEAAAAEPLEAPEPEPVVDAGTPQPGQVPRSIAEFNARRQLRETAELEAARDRWLAMPAEYRERVRGEYERAAGDATRLSESRQGALEAEAAARREAQQQFPQPGIVPDPAPGETLPPGAAQQPVQTPPPGAVEPVAPVAPIDPVGPTPIERQQTPVTPVTPDVPIVDPTVPQPAAPLPPAGIEDPVQTQREVDTRLHAAQAAADDRAGRLQAALERFNRFEAEQEQGPLVSALETQRVAEYDGSAPGEISFSVDAPVMRIDWDAEPGHDQALVTGTVYEAGTDRPVARFRSTDPPHEAFLILDGDDDFYIRTETQGPVTYSLQVFAIDEG